MQCEPQRGDDPSVFAVLVVLRVVAAQPVLVEVAVMVRRAMMDLPGMAMCGKMVEWCSVVVVETRHRLRVEWCSAGMTMCGKMVLRVPVPQRVLRREMPPWGLIQAEIAPATAIAPAAQQLTTAAAAVTSASIVDPTHVVNLRDVRTARVVEIVVRLHGSPPRPCQSSRTPAATG